ncbi:MAG: hypothetical protein K6B14_01460 [Lachnospiraceae bacterium]|nr:hypothetical protein [Lachnospiraceae bacterium]
MAGINYSVKNNRLKKSGLYGMDIAGPGVLNLSRDMERHLYLPAIDSAEENASWGRLSFNCDITENMVSYVYVLATDDCIINDGDRTLDLNKLLTGDEASESEKKHFLDFAGAKRIVDKDDILLYDLTGRYFFICIDIVGEGTGKLSDIRIDRHGDNFMDTFPSIYRERDGFFHRFLSVFSTIYNDFEREIDDLPKLLDSDTAPPEMLLAYGRWLGLDLSGDFLSEETMRTFVREGYRLNRMKGTRACLERVLEIVLGEKVIILEQNTIRSYLEEGEISIGTLEDSSIYDVNVLIKKKLSDTDRHQLLHLLRQFVPLRSRIHLIRLKDSGVLDTDIYLDMNAVLAEESYGVFDEDMEMDDDIILDE